MKFRKYNKFLFFIIYFLLASIGGYLAFYAMKWGPWAFSDSSAYVSAARNIASGNGIVIHHSTGVEKALTEFPPFYPVVLSVFGGSKLDYIRTIRCHNVFLFSSSIFLLSQIIQLTTRNHLLSIIASMLFISSPQIISTFTSAMSEPLFLFLLLLSVYLLQLIFQNSMKFFQFFFYFISSLLPMTRYAGGLFIVIYGISLFSVFPKSSLIKKIRSIIIYYLIALLPVGYWIWSLYDRVNILGGKYYFLSTEILSNIARSLVDEFRIIRSWFPYIEIYKGTITELLIISTIVLLFILLIGWAIKLFLFSNKEIKSYKKQIFTLMFFLIAGYIFFIGLTHSITLPQIDIIDRTMIPIYPLGIILVFHSLDFLIRNTRYKYFLITLIITLSFVFFRYNSFLTNTYIRNMNSDGYGFTSRVIQQSGLIKEIQKISDDREMISNSAGFVLFYTNRYPIQVDNFRNYSFGSGDSYGEKSFREKNAALIILFSDFSNYYGIEANKLLSNLTTSLNADYIDNEGGIYYYY